MKTLIINGSTNATGDTAALIAELTAHLDGEIKTLSAGSDIAPCRDCRYCWRHSGCVIDDEMQAVYEYLPDCDNIILASPIWFSSLSGPLLNIASRLQTYFAAGRFRGEKPCFTEKNGVIIIAGAQRKIAGGPLESAMIIMRLLNVSRQRVVNILSLNTDIVPAGEDETALRQCREAAARLNGLCR